MLRTPTMLCGGAVAAIALLGVLGLMQTTWAAPRDVQLPFGNPVEQRNAMIQELQEIKGLLREQNALLRTLVQRQSASPDRPGQ